MKRKKTQIPQKELQALSTKFKKWRTKRKSQRERIPEKLLQQAALLSESVPCSQVAKILDLNYTKLKNAIKNEQSRKDHNSTSPREHKHTKTPCKEPSYTFLPLKTAGELVFPSSEIIIEKQDGTKINIKLAGFPTAETIQSIRLLI